MTERALCCVGLDVREGVTLCFTDSATGVSPIRMDEQPDLAGHDLEARAARIRSGDFAADPSPS